jgi:group I intron endonuclease
MTKRPRLKSGIYQIVNLENGKCYVGSAKTLTRRKWLHFNDLREGTHNNDRLQNAFDSYGENNFKFRILEHCKPENLIEREQYWMDQLKATDAEYGYNICPVAGSNLGITYSCPQSSARHKGQPKPAKQRRKMSKSAKQSWSDPDVYEQRLKTFKTWPKRKKHREDTKQKMSVSHLNLSEQSKANVQAGKDAYWASERGKKHKVKLREANERRHWAKVHKL